MVDFIHLAEYVWRAAWSLHTPATRPPNGGSRSSWRTAAHLRDLPMDARVLPKIDRQILLFERWSRHRLAQIDDPEHARLLRQFTTWRLLPELHGQAARGPLTNGSRNTAAGRFNIAETFLNWLGGRVRRLDQAAQTDIDAWHVERPDPGRLHAFLK
ncbi:MULTISPECIES: hypothetical protein [Thermomonosporaceae]|uniref:hypothetical protein n=1 Tax=Thermomonosporaceae TaxID=2012 RepID=UPI00255ACF70|nr:MULTISPECIES: hypothetical protein [Thermomonosporaceae]MDL4775761.1 hypothetical protein [Actinomadura xylanilytica]